MRRKKLFLREQKFQRFRNSDAVLVLALVVLPVFNRLAAQNINFITEIDRLYNLSLLPQFMDGSTVKQFSSYDRTGGNNDGFEGTYSFVRKNNDSSLVVFETEGKGVIERLWTPTPTNDTLDFYLDGGNSPSFSIKFNDLFTGKIYPFIFPIVGQHFVGGYYCYLPIPYKNGCKIVFRGKKMNFYQFQYRQYPSNYHVETFNPFKITDHESYELNKLTTYWINGSHNGKIFYDSI